MPVPHDENIGWRYSLRFTHISCRSPVDLVYPFNKRDDLEAATKVALID